MSRVRSSSVFGGPLRVSRSALAALAALWITTAPAAAAKHVPPRQPIAGPFLRFSTDGTHLLAPICELGETDTSTTSIPYVTSFPDRYLTLLPSSACQPCIAPDTLLLKLAHAVLAFTQQCVVHLNVSIVGTRNVGGCIKPDTTVVLCPARAVTVEPTSAGTFDFAMPLVSSCYVARDAFLLIEFTAFGPECTVQSRPALVLSSQCVNCESFNDYYSSGINAWQEDDLCVQFGNARPTMYVDGELCTTPVLERSWGSLKVLYR